MLEADFVIVGSGSAGSALAYRLSEDGRHSVIVIEFGGTDMGPLIQMPSALSFPMNMSLYDWGFSSEPEPHLGGRVLATPRGKVLGGSSSINGMVYVRGHARDFDHWAEQGARPAGFCGRAALLQAHGNLAWRGGRLARHRRTPARAARTAPEPALRRLHRGRCAGRFRADGRHYNGAKQEGFGAMEQTIYRGRRWSAANAYLRPALRRKNVRLVRGFARKIIIENDPATGVEIDVRGKPQMGGAARTGAVSARTCRTISNSTSSRKPPSRSRCIPC